jgi:heme-degrading monooxygenase HmoA
MATYSFTGDADALSRRAEEGLLPLLNAQPGFKSYTIAVGDGEVISISAWDSRADAEAGSDAVASWVADNLAAELTLKDVRYAEIKLSTTLGVSTAAAAA